MCCLVQEGDEVLIPEPYWVTFPDQVRLAGGTPVFVPTKPEEQFLIKPEEIEKRITSQFACVNFEQPEQSFWCCDSARYNGRDRAVMRAKKSRSLIFDECYDCFVFPPHKHTSPFAYFPGSARIYFRCKYFFKSLCNDRMASWICNWTGRELFLLAINCKVIQLQILHRSANGQDLKLWQAIKVQCN